MGVWGQGEVEARRGEAVQGNGKLSKILVFSKM